MKQYTVRFLEKNTTPWQKKTAHWTTLKNGRKVATFESDYDAAMSAKKYIEEFESYDSFYVVAKCRIMCGNDIVREYTKIKLGD